MLWCMLLKPFLFQGNEIELIGSRELAIEPILIHEIAETSLAGSSLDEFVVPGFREIPQLGGRDVTYVKLMGSIGYGRTEASEPVLQLRFESRIRLEFARWLGSITGEIRHVRQ